MDTNILFFDTQYDQNTNQVSFGYLLFSPKMEILSSGETKDAKKAVELLSTCFPICYDLSYNYPDIVAFYNEVGEPLDLDKPYISLFDFYRYKRHLHFYVSATEALFRLANIDEGNDPSTMSAKELARLNRTLYEELHSKYSRGKDGLYCVPSALTSLGKVAFVTEGLNKRLDLIHGRLDELKGKRKYIFFDIECANTDFAEGKICEFSYVIYDESWKLVEKKEILINPGEGEDYDFKLIGRPGSTDLHLKYEDNDYQAYRESPEFSEFALSLKELLLDPESVILGYEVESDLRFLAYSFSRYGVDVGPLFALDVKRVYQQILNKPVRSLGDLVERFVPKEAAKGLQFHAAIDDATATGLVLRYFLLLKSLSFDELLDMVDEDAICEMTTSFYPDPDLADPATFDKLKEDKLI